MTTDALLTDLIQQAQSGDSDALHRVFEATYQDLRSMARQRLRANARGTLLDTTALVHESFLKFSKAGQLNLSDRQHFLRYASQTMRSIIVDYVRERMAERRGGGLGRVTLNTHLEGNDIDGAEEILKVHEALEELAALDARIAQVVEMRYFGGLTEIEIAEALGVTDRTVRRDWEKARVLLARALKD